MASCLAPLTVDLPVYGVYRFSVRLSGFLHSPPFYLNSRSGLLHSPIRYLHYPHVLNIYPSFLAVYPKVIRLSRQSRYLNCLAGCSECLSDCSNCLFPRWPPFSLKWLLCPSRQSEWIFKLSRCLYN